MHIVIRTLPHAEQRYDTVGDWRVTANGTWDIRVSDLGSWKFNLLVALHELVELALCHDHEVTTAQVDEFDLAWQPHNGIDEPGDDLMAPYYLEHQVASGFERLMAAELGVVWSEYERVIESLSNNGEHSDDTHSSGRSDRERDPGEGLERTEAHP